MMVKNNHFATFFGPSHASIMYCQHHCHTAHDSVKVMKLTKTSGTFTPSKNGIDSKTFVGNGHES